MKIHDVNGCICRTRFAGLRGTTHVLPYGPAAAIQAYNHTTRRIKLKKNS